MSFGPSSMDDPGGPADEALEAGRPGPLRRWGRWLLALYWPALAVATHLPNLKIDAGGARNLRPDQLIHLGLFGLLTLLLASARPLGRRFSPATNVLAATVLASLYGYADEWTQGWTGRWVSFEDALINQAAVLGVGALLLRHELGPGTRWRAWASRATAVLAAPLLLYMALANGFRPSDVAFTMPLARFLGIASDKLGHFAVAAGLVWVLVAGRLAGRRRPVWSWLLAVLLLTVVAPAAEYVQFRTGRGWDLADVWAHYEGMAAGLAAWSLLVVAAYLRQRFGRAARGGGGADPGMAAAPGEAAGGTAFVGHARLVSVLTLLSRLTGLVRDALQARYMGLGGVSDAFTIGFMIPNLFRRLFGEGALTAAFIPAYTDLLKRDRELARRFVTLCVALLCLVLGAATLAGEAVLYGLLDRFGDSPDLHLAVRLTMIMLPYMPLVCLVALVGAVLQVHGRFGPSASAPILLNVVMIAATVWAFAGSGNLPADLREPFGREVVDLVAWSVLLAGLVQCLWQLLAMLRYEAFSATCAGAWGPMRAMLWTMLPTLLALSVFQVNTFLDSALAMVLSPKAGGPDQLHLLGWAVRYPIEQGGVAALAWSQRLYQFPLGVFGIAIATAIFPALAHAAARRGGDSEVHFVAILRHGLRLTVFIGLPASLGLILVRVPLCRVIYEGRDFKLEDSLRCAGILAAYAPAIWAYSMAHVLTRGFYARKDTRTPMVLSLVIVGLNLSLNLVLVWPLGAAGLGLSTAICSIVQCWLMVRLMRHHAEPLVDRSVWRSWGRTALLTVLMAAALWPVTFLRDPAALSRGQALGQLGAMVGMGLVVLVGGAWAFGMEELRWLLRRRA